MVPPVNQRTVLSCAPTDLTTICRLPSSPSTWIATRCSPERTNNSGSQRLAFARLHFGDRTIEQGNAADDLDVEMPHLQRAPAGFAPIAIGLGLTLIHLISIPVTNTSVNPARSTGVALFAGGWALKQLWLFWVAPIVGAIAAGFVYRWLDKEDAS